MSAKRRPGGGGARRQAETDARSDSRCQPPRPALPPIEVHDPIADDKLIWFERSRVELLTGVWQGPGTIAKLREWQP